MRRILVDHARLHATQKRGHHPIHFSIDDVQIPVEERAGSLLALDEVLERLAKLDETQARIVEMRFFGGMNKPRKSPRRWTFPKEASGANGRRRDFGSIAS